MYQFSLLKSCPKPRPLAAALAHEFARTKWSDTKRMELLNRIYVRLSPLDQLGCKLELRLCKAAQRGELLAEVG